MNEISEQIIVDYERRLDPSPTLEPGKKVVSEIVHTAKTLEVPLKNFLSIAGTGLGAQMIFDLPQENSVKFQEYLETLNAKGVRYYIRKKQ